MTASSATRFAVIDEKLDHIQKDLSDIKNWMQMHAVEHTSIADRLSQQALINKALYFVSGLLVAGVIKLIFFKGG